jgi:hypothetical protein
MVSIIMCLHRIPSLNRAEFQHYWATTHKPLVIERASILRIAQYSQLHTLTLEPGTEGILSRGSASAYDGIAKATFETLGDLLAAGRDTRAAKAAAELIEDEIKFIDRARSPLFLVHDPA